MRGLEVSVYRIIEEINRVLTQSSRTIKYSVTIKDRERKVPSIGKSGNEIKPKKQYYGLLLFLLKDGDKRVVLWRQEYVFYNLTDKTKDLLWKEKLCEAFIYESLGVFAVITEANYNKDVAEGSTNAGTYDEATDTFIPTPQAMSQSEETNPVENS